MKAEYVNPFIHATCTVFDTLLGCQLTSLDPFVKRSMQPEYHVSGIIGLSGKAKGIVVLSLSRDVALSAVGAMLGDRPLEINADVADAVGELTNNVVGVAKAQLEHLNMTVSMPTVVTGTTHTVEFPRTVTPICLPFECEWGPVAVEFGLVEE